MKRRLFALLLAAVVLLAAVPLQARAASDVCFVSINDTLPENRRGLIKKLLSVRR